jgi:quercetin dioxygenase-like cupin family protein
VGAYVVRLPAGERDPRLTHAHDGEEWVMGLEGVVEIRIDETAHVLREGDTLHFWAHHRHGYANLGSTPARVLMSCRPRIVL